MKNHPFTEEELEKLRDILRTCYLAGFENETVAIAIRAHLRLERGNEKLKWFEDLSNSLALVEFVQDIPFDDFGKYK